ncbi:MAG TPA: TIM barrel protein [Fimbriimonadaceae bacterium]|nr:TIM barrel protein [Fimbriimonadaceae bacterium]
MRAGAALAASSVLPAFGEKPMNPKFKMKFGPHFGMFQNHAGNDLVDQLKFAADEGFSAWEDNGMRGRSPQDQEKLGKAMRDLGITMGVFVVNDIDWSKPTLTTGGKEHLDRFIQNCKDSVEVAKRVGAKWMTVVPGVIEPRLEPGYQTANVIEALRQGADIFEPHGLVMVLEPLNYRDHPNLFLNKVAQAFMICRAVDSPSCKILDDLYHQQIHEGNLIPNMDAAWSEIAYFQIGDNPGRREPTTGEINYKNVFKHIASKGFTGVMGMEHGNAKPGKEGERALIEAYRSVDLT